MRRRSPSSTTRASASSGGTSELKQALRQVRDRETGELLNGVRERLEAAVAERRDSLERASLDTVLTTEQVDVTLPGAAMSRGHLHLITQIRREVEDVFLGLGYEIFDGPEVEDTYHNFTALNTPAWHPSASKNDTFYVGDQVALRTHTSPGQIRYMETHQPPVYMVSLGRCYRRDTPDPTHMPVFHQVEGLAVDKGITLADLKGTLMYLSRALFGEDRNVRIRTSYFPFTEPSLEFDVSCFVCDQSGCSHVRPLRLAGDGRLRRRRPERLRARRLRPRGGLGLRVRARARAHRHAPAWAARSAAAVGERPPADQAVLGKR